MARRCLIEKNNRRLKLIQKYAKRRAELRESLRDRDIGFEKKIEIQEALQALPRDSNRCRRRNRCEITGRSRGVYRRFGLGRNKLREYAMSGLIPGLRKASW